MKTQSSLAYSLVMAGCIAMTGLAVATPAYATDPATIEAKFKAADNDGDGKLTREEAKAGMPLIARNFDKLDAEKKNYLTLEQVQAAAR